MRGKVNSQVTPGVGDTPPSSVPSSRENDPCIVGLALLALTRAILSYLGAAEHVPVDDFLELGLALGREPPVCRRRIHGSVPLQRLREVLVEPRLEVAMRTPRRGEIF